MLHYLKHSEINKQKWDECISVSYNSRVYAMSWHLDVVCPQWEALVEDDYKAVMPVTARKKYQINYLFQPHFTQQLGIFSGREIEKNSIEKFLNSIPEKFRFVEICINSENSEALLTPNIIGEEKRSVVGFSIKKNSNYELELNKKYESIYRGYSENTKRNIKKAVKSGVSISSGQIDISELMKLFRINKGKEFSHLKNDYYVMLHSLAKVCKEKKSLKMLGAFNQEKKLCAGAVFIIYKGRAIFLFSATNNEAKKNGAIFFLLDRFIFEHTETLAILDFEGSNDANLARFYKSFGAKEYVYLQLKKNNLPKYIQWLKQ